MKKTPKRILALLLSLVMLVGMIATSAVAAPPGGDMPGGPGGPGGGPGGPGGPAAEPDPNSPHFEEADGANDPAIEVGSFGSKYAYPRYAEILNESRTDAAIDDSTSWHNGAIYSEAGEYTLSGSIKMDTKADGKDTNDFSGLGAAVMAAGEGVQLTIEDADIETTGVAKLALFTDNGAVSIVKNSTLTAKGGVIYDDYVSTADQALMVSPPWVLGMGGNAEKPVNARTTNIMGDYSTAAYVDSTFNAAGWGALSTDTGTNMHMVVVNSQVNVKDADGYGAYTIGESTEDYYGVALDVTTYANIMTGGVATYQSYTEGKEIDVYQYSGDKDSYGFGTGGTKVATVKSESAKGTVNSTIKANEFAFMCHANGPSGWNVVNVIDNTEVETGNAIFLVKKVNAEFNVDNAKLTSGNNTIVQIIDNDDDYVGVMPASNEEWGHDNLYGHVYGTHMPTFNSKFEEKPGYSNEWIADSSAAGQAGYDTNGNWVVNYNMTNTTVTGNLWNSSGYVGSNPASTLNVTLGEGANLTGIISAGAFSHNIKDATVGNGDWTNAKALGHVTNIANSNGVNLVNVTLTDNASWKVTGDGIVNDLTASSTAITADEAVTITVYGVLTLDGERVNETKTVGNVTYKVMNTVVTETKTFDEGLTINKGEAYTAEEGYAVIMTVDGVQKDIVPGEYEGKVVLTPVKESTGTYENHGAWSTKTMTAALSFDDDGVVGQVESALQNITWTEKDGVITIEGKDGKIVSQGDYFGGLRFTSGSYDFKAEGEGMMAELTYTVEGGEKEYVVKGITFDLTGNGGDDFAGIGAAIAVVGNAKVTVEDCTIITHGALRSAIFAGNDANVTIKNCTIETHSLWADEENQVLADVSIPGAGMTVPPAGLGVYGNNRANNMVGAPNVTYENCTISADAWGAMACDAIYPAEGEEVFQNLINCTIKIGGAGYGAYAIGHIWDVLDGTTIEAENGMGVIVAAEGSTKLQNNAKIISQRFGIVTHQGMGAVAGIVVTGGSSIEAKYTGILVKERAADIEISGKSNIKVTDGALIQAVDNDDSGAGGGETGSEKVTVKLSDVTLTGDIFQSMSAIPMEVSLDKDTTVTGAISTAAATFRNGGKAPAGMVSSAGYEERAIVGVVDANSRTNNQIIADLDVTLEEGAKWVVTANSSVTNLTASSASITAEKPVTVNVTGTLTLDGEVVTEEKTVDNVTFTVGVETTAYPSSSSSDIYVNGEKVATVDAYVLKDMDGNETNYLKLRDLAEILKDTEAKFNVTWNAETGKIEIVGGEDYEANGTEGQKCFEGEQNYVRTSGNVTVDGTEVSADAIVLTDEEGGGHTYFGLRALDDVLGYKVDWNGDKGTIEITATEAPSAPSTGGPGGMPGGEMPGGGMPGGEMPGGGMPGGEMPGGEMPGGEMPGGEMPGGEMPGGEMPGGEMPGGEMPPM